jgi:hypothetical protein
MQENGQLKPAFHDIRQTANAVVGLAQVLCKPAEVVLRVPGTWGERYANFQMVLGWLFLFFFPALFFRGDDPRPCWWLFAGVTAWLCVHRVAGIWRRWRGYRPHSMYSGRSGFGGNEVRAKTFLEPLLLITGGIVLLGWDRPLGTYVILSGVTLGIAGAWQVAADNAQIRAARDAQLDAAWLQERMGG